MLLNIDPPPRPARPEELTEARSDGPRATAGTVPSVATSVRRPTAEPSWGRVLATNLRLWLARQGNLRRARPAGVVVAAAVVTVAALALSGVFSGTAAPAARARAASTPSPVRARAHPAPVPPSPVPTAGAAWIARQLSG